MDNNNQSIDANVHDAALDQFIKENNLIRTMLDDNTAQYTKIINGILNTFGNITKKNDKYAISIYYTEKLNFQFDSEIDALKELVKCVNIIIDFGKS